MRVEAEGLLALHVCTAGLEQALGHGQEVAGGHVAAGADADLLVPIAQDLRAGHRQADQDGIRVVAAHHPERQGRVAAARVAAVYEEHAAGTAAHQCVGGGGPDESGADDHDVVAGHGGTVPPCAYQFTPGAVSCTVRR